MHSIWSPLPPRCHAEGCIPAEDRSAATYVHSHTCWNTSYLFKTTSNCTTSHVENVYSNLPSQKYSKSLNGSVLLFYYYAASSFPCLSHCIGSCDSCYSPPLPTRLNLSKVAWGKRADPCTASPPTLWRVFLSMFLHLLPSLLLTSYVRNENFSKSPNPNGIILTES